MRNYDRVNALPPDGIGDKRAHVIGGGIVGLAAAAFLVSDAHMPAANVTVYESLPVLGGSMDAALDGTMYTSRGERELEARMECLWYLCGKVPSLYSPGQTILDETHRYNAGKPIYSHYRLMEKQGQLYDYSGPLMSRADAVKLMQLVFTPEEMLEDLTATDWFSPEFTTSVFWYCWSSMLAFRDYHCLIEVKRYLARFMMYTRGLTHLDGILHTRYNEYDSIIKPVQIWLEGQGVTFRTGTTVRDIQVDLTDGKITATSLAGEDRDGTWHLGLTPDDLVFFTNGSMTQNTTMGSTHTVATLNRDTRDLGCFDVWNKLAAQDPRFGNPRNFISDIGKTNWISFFTTLTADPAFYDYMQAKTGDAANTGGAITIVDSSWKLSFVLYDNAYYPGQPEDTVVFWAYGQVSDVPGDYVEKPMQECTGAEMLAELLYHCGLEDKAGAILAHAEVSTAAMPYITSQFMPRKISDRPKVIPNGSVNLAFIGQFAELPGDVVFTVETSVRTAMMAVWGLTGLDKPLIPLYEPAYDLRVLADSLKGSLGVGELTEKDLSALAAGGIPDSATLLRLLNTMPLPAK